MGSSYNRIRFQSPSLSEKPNMCSFFYAIMIFGGVAVLAIVIGIPFYLWFGQETIDMVSEINTKTADLTCWHCGKQTSSQRGRCLHCHQELR